MSKNIVVRDLLEFFPEVELPITLTEDLVATFSSNNRPLPEAILKHYIFLWESEIDEFTEYVPCFRIPDDPDILILVYWKGGLLKHEYILVTLTKNGELIERKIISSLISDNRTVRQSIAHIDEDLIITIMAGEHDPSSLYDPKNSQSFTMEIMSDGKILFSNE